MLGIYHACDTWIDTYDVCECGYAKEEQPETGKQRKKRKREKKKGRE